MACKWHLVASWHSVGAICGAVPATQQQQRGTWRTPWPGNARGKGRDVGSAVCSRRIGGRSCQRAPSSPPPQEDSAAAAVSSSTSLADMPQSRQPPLMAGSWLGGIRIIATFAVFVMMQTSLHHGPRLQACSQLQGASGIRMQITDTANVATSVLEQRVICAAGLLAFQTWPSLPEGTGAL